MHPFRNGSAVETLHTDCSWKHRLCLDPAAFAISVVIGTYTIGRPWHVGPGQHKDDKLEVRLVECCKTHFLL